MATIAFGMLPHPSHYNATYQTARTLADRGHRVVYVSHDDGMKEDVRNQGLEFECLSERDVEAPPQEPPVRSAGKLRQLVEGYRNARMLFDEFVDGRSVRALIDRIEPDLVVLDCSLGHLAITCHPRPAILLSTSLYLGKDVNIPALDSNLIPRSGLWSRFRAELSWWPYLVRRDLREVMWGWFGLGHYRLLAKTAEKNGYPLEKMVNRRRWFMPTLKLPEIVLVPKEFDFPRPEHALVNFTGPGVLEDRREPDFDWSGIDDTRPLALCALGSVSKILPGHKSLLRRVVAAFEAKPDWQLLMAVGEHLDPADFGAVGSNIVLARKVPQLEALRRARVAIHHAGINSIKECVLLGVPMVMFPSINDCFGAAARASFHGIGLRLPVGARSGDIGQAVEEVSEHPPYRTSIRRIQELFRQADERHSAADFIESYVEAGTPGARTVSTAYSTTAAS